MEFIVKYGNFSEHTVFDTKDSIDSPLAQCEMLSICQKSEPVFLSAIELSSTGIPLKKSNIPFQYRFSKYGIMQRFSSKLGHRKMNRAISIHIRAEKTRLRKIRDARKSVWLPLNKFSKMEV